MPIDLATKTDLAVSSAVPADITNRTGRYDAATCIYTPANSRPRAYRAAVGKAIAGVGYYEVLCIGDSTTWGYAGVSPDPASISYPVQLAQNLIRGGIPEGGSGWVFPNAQGNNPDQRWTFSAGWSSQAVGISYVQTSTNGATALFTSNRAGTIVDLAYFNNGGPFTYSIDGAAAVTVTPTATGAVNTVSVTGLPNTTHTVLMTTTSTSTSYCVAVRVRQQFGIAVTNAGISGATSLHWAPSAAWFSPFPETVTGLGAITTYGATIICLGLNEQGTAAATFKTQLTAIATAAPGTVILAIPVTPQGSGAAWTAFRNAYYDIADTLGVQLIDIGELQGDYSTANASGFRFDGLHPTAAGYADIANAAASALNVPGPGPVGDRKWTAPTLQNSWANYSGTTFVPAGYRKDATGVVRLRGLIQGGTATPGTTLFTLPAGYRPTATEVFPSASGDVFGEIRISTAGVVAIHAGSATWLTLSGISFYAAA